MSTYQNDANALDKARDHAWFHHREADGWITVAKKDSEGDFKHIHYRPEDLADNLSEWIGEDVYFSQNTFYRPRRRIEDIRQLRSLYIDLDFYLFNFDPSWILGKLEHEYFGESVPNPNLIIFSGRGVVLIWLIEPVPYKALPLWQAVQNHFLSLLENLGGDSQATDAARVFRLAGTINSKNGAEVYTEIRHEYKYELRQIQQDFLPVLDSEITPPTKKKKGRKKKVAQLFNIYKLHHTRLLDLVKLVELRSYDVEGYRELLCFLYRYWLCCYTNDPSESLNSTVSFNLEFKNPLSNVEVEKATRSAEKAWEARNNREANNIAIERGYPGAGYNISNKKLISWLDITEEEQKQLKTIIGPNEKRKRNTTYQRKKRHADGVRTRNEYLAQETKKTQESLEKLREVLSDNRYATIREIQEKTGLSVGYIHKLKKEINGLEKKSSS